MLSSMEKLCRVRDVQRSIIAFEHRFVKDYGICLNEGMLLCSLCKSECLSSGELGDLLGLTLSNTSKVIVSVERKGLVKRILGKKDKRQMYFMLTERGKELISSVNCEEMEVPDILKEAVLE